jgi:2-dehydro-3-deoxygluconokinase
MDTAPTGILVRDVQGQRAVEVVYARTASAGSRLCSEDLPVGKITGARIRHVTGITPLPSSAAAAATEQALAVARESGMTVSFDPNIRLRSPGSGGGSKRTPSE